MRAYLIVGKPGSGKSTLIAELSRRGLIALDADDLAFWEDSAGLQVIQPADADDAWRFAHRWVWSRTRNLQAITAASGDASSTFFCGIARNQAEMLDSFDVGSQRSCCRERRRRDLRPRMARGGVQ